MMDRFLADDGCAIAFDYRPVNGRPVLILSPSLGTAMALFEPQAEALGADYSLLLYDPRGHGASEVPAGAYSLDRLGRDVVGLLDHLSIERAHFAGVSLGGMVGQWLGFRSADRINRLILANTSAYMGPPEGWVNRIAAVSAHGMEALSASVIERWFTLDFQREQPERVDHARTMLLATDPQGYAGCSAAIRDMDLRPTAACITIPTLVIGGLLDPATPPEHARFLARAIAGARLVELGAAHLANLEQSFAFNMAVAEFLKEAR
jgi:3-oxoadipate enol-lactonase